MENVQTFLKDIFLVILFNNYGRLHLLCSFEQPLHFRSAMQVKKKKTAARTYWCQYECKHKWFLFCLKKTFCLAVTFRCHAGLAPLPGGVQLYLAIVQVEEAVDKESPLQHQAGHQEVDADRAQAVPLQKRHQEPEADKDHHVHVLKHFNRNTPLKTPLLSRWI